MAFRRSTVRSRPSPPIKKDYQKVVFFYWSSGAAREVLRFEHKAQTRSGCFCEAEFCLVSRRRLAAGVSRPSPPIKKDYQKVVFFYWSSGAAREAPRFEHKARTRRRQLLQSRNLPCVAKAACRRSIPFIFTRKKSPPKCGSSFKCIFAYYVPEQDTQVIPAAIENAIHKDFIFIDSIKGEIISGHKKAIIAFYIGNRSKRRARLHKICKLVYRFHDTVYNAFCGDGALKFRCNVIPYFIQITLGFFRIKYLMLHLFLRGNAPSSHPGSASPPFRRTSGPWQARS